MTHLKSHQRLPSLFPFTDQIESCGRLFAAKDWIKTNLYFCLNSEQPTVIDFLDYDFAVIHITDITTLRLKGNFYNPAIQPLQQGQQKDMT